MKANILFILCPLTGLMFINAGLDKFFNYMPIPKEMPEKMARVWKSFMEIGWLMPLIGAIEVIGNLLLIFSKTRALGAVVVLPVLTGILLANISMAPSGLPIVFILMGIIGWGIIENKEKYLPMIRK